MYFISCAMLSSDEPMSLFPNCPPASPCRYGTKLKQGTVAQIVSQSYTESVDIWSCGIILFVLLVGSKRPSPPTLYVFFSLTPQGFLDTPWDEPTTRCEEFRLYISAKDPPFPPWDRIHVEEKEFLQHLLNVCVETRWGLPEIQQSPWFLQENSLLRGGKCADQVALATLLISTHDHDRAKSSKPRPGDLCIGRVQ